MHESDWKGTYNKTMLLTFASGSGTIYLDGRETYFSMYNPFAIFELKKKRAWRVPTSEKH